MLKQEYRSYGQTMSRQLKLLITGGTGFLGQYVVQHLGSDVEVDVLSRSGRTGLTGDLSRWKGGLNPETLSSKKYDILVHLAGLYDLRASENDVYLHNVVGTNTALQIATQLKIPIFINASSIAAASNLSSQQITPYDLDLTTVFPDAYSQSKALGERLLQNWSGGPQLRINLRLGILVGESRNGKILRADGPYAVANYFKGLKYALKIWKTSLPVPGNPEVRIPLVPVDQAAQAIREFCLWAQRSQERGYQSFHLVPREGVRVADLYESIFEHLGLSHINLKLTNRIPASFFKILGKKIVDLPQEQLRYALQLPLYDSKSTQEILGENWCSEFSDYKLSFWRGYEEFLSNR